MPRPTKCRQVEFVPINTRFVPEDKINNCIEEEILKVEELEAIRLKDLEGLNQEECAKRMQVSRQTFQNIIDNARKKVAIALIEGKAICINGGNFTFKNCKFKCLDCNNYYFLHKEEDKSKCPECGSNQVVCIKKMKACQKWCDYGNVLDEKG